MDPHASASRHHKSMIALLPETLDILGLVKRRTGRPIEFVKDEKLNKLAALQAARGTSPSHIIRYKPSSGPIDYFVAHQAGYLLRSYENPPEKRFDFMPLREAAQRDIELNLCGERTGSVDRDLSAQFSMAVAEWALMTLRSLPVGMRIDLWIALAYPGLADLQRSELTQQQSQNLPLLSQRVRNLAVPATLLALNSAFAIFTDRLLGGMGFTLPYDARGLRSAGHTLMELWDSIDVPASNDCKLVDSWAAATAMNNWYKWIPFQQ